MNKLTNVACLLLLLITVGCTGAKHNGFSKIRVNKTLLEPRAKSLEKGNTFTIKSHPKDSSSESTIFQNKEVITAGGSIMDGLTENYKMDGSGPNLKQTESKAFSKTEKVHPKSKHGWGQVNRMAKASFILTILAYFFLFLFITTALHSGAFVLAIFPILFGLSSVIFGIVGLVQISRDGDGGKGYAIAGIILGVLNIALSVFAMSLAIKAFLLAQTLALI